MRVVCLHILWFWPLRSNRMWYSSCRVKESIRQAWENEGDSNRKVRQEGNCITAEVKWKRSNHGEDLCGHSREAANKTESRPRASLEGVGQLHIVANCSWLSRLRSHLCFWCVSFTFQSVVIDPPETNQPVWGLLETVLDNAFTGPNGSESPGMIDWIEFLFSTWKHIFGLMVDPYEDDRDMLICMWIRGQIQFLEQTPRISTSTKNMRRMSCYLLLPGSMVFSLTLVHYLLQLCGSCGLLYDFASSRMFSDSCIPQVLSTIAWCGQRSVVGKGLATEKPFLIPLYLHHNRDSFRLWANK